MPQPDWPGAQIVLKRRLVGENAGIGIIAQGRDMVGVQVGEDDRPRVRLRVRQGRRGQARSE